MRRHNWIEDSDGYVHMTRGGNPHKVHVAFLDAIRNGAEVASCMQEYWAAHDHPLPPGYTGHGKTGMSKAPARPRKPTKRQLAEAYRRATEPALF